jgi:hypothetical protein
MSCLESYGTDIDNVWYWVVLPRFVPLQLRLKSEKNSEKCTWNITCESARNSSKTMRRSPKCFQQEFYKRRTSSTLYRKSVFQTIKQKWANAPELLRCAYFIYRVSNSSFLGSEPVVSYVWRSIQQRPCCLRARLRNTANQCSGVQLSCRFSFSRHTLHVIAV